MIARRRFLLRTGILLAAGLLRPRLASANDDLSLCEAFHVGPYDLLRDRSLNFQLNRWISYGGESILADIQAMLPRLVSLDAWRDEFSAASDRALAAGHLREAAILARGRGMR